MSADMPEDNLPDEKQTHDAAGPAASESEPAAVAVASTLTFTAHYVAHEAGLFQEGRKD